MQRDYRHNCNRNNRVWTPPRGGVAQSSDRRPSEEDGFTKKYGVMVGMGRRTHLVHQTNSKFGAVWFAVKAIVSGKYNRVHFEFARKAGE